MQQHSKSKVCYYYDSDIGNYYYGQVDRQMVPSFFKVLTKYSPGSPHEAPPYEDDPQPAPQLWTLQKDGGLQVKPAACSRPDLLVADYELLRSLALTNLNSCRPHKATQDEMTKFHSDDYIRFLR